jgi:hypothetical protein
VLLGAAFATLPAPNRYFCKFETCGVYKGGWCSDEFAHMNCARDCPNGRVALSMMRTGTP